MLISKKEWLVVAVVFALANVVRALFFDWVFHNRNIVQAKFIGGS